MATLPYNPWSILVPTANSTSLFVLQPPTVPSATPQLLSLDISQPLSSASLQYKPISSPLPFTTHDNEQAYIPVVADDGSLWIYTGDCRKESRGSALWRFTAQPGSSAGTGRWDQIHVDLKPDTPESGSLSAGFLSSGMTFAATRNATAGIYVFGGMCPNSTNVDAQQWTQAASYSNTMLNISPDDSSAPSDPSYLLSISASRGAPIPEAGFSITPLALGSDDDDFGTQNQNFVLVGGHTQQAFINMSQVALFSLPEQSWTFVPIHDPTPGPKTDLAARNAATVEPRSGHTAVRSADGTRIIVFGGWVGDTDSFANPQLALLDIGNGYGGRGDWKWTVPDQTASGPEPNAGIFGHGAVMLPGNVMMIVGGYQIPHSSHANAKRVAGPALNSKHYFYNISSNAWVDSYSMPTASSEAGTPHAAEKEQMTAVKKAGLGAGLTLAILAVIALTVFAFWYTRKLQRRRDAREAELKDLADNARRDHPMGSRSQHMQQKDAGMTVVDWVGGASRQRDTSYGRLPEGAGDADDPNGSESAVHAARTGMLFEIPSPTRGLRRSLHTRGSYHPAPRYDQSRAIRGSGGIHPIDEKDEDEEEEDQGKSGEYRTDKQLEDVDLLATAPKLDPFRDPDEDRTPSPKATGPRKDPEGHWIKEWATAEAIARQQAAQRASPDKADRTSSTLSDQSAHSAVSAMSWPYSLGSMNRSVSQRSAQVFTTGNHAPPGPSGGDAPNPQTLSRGPSGSYGRSQPMHPTAGPRPPASSETYTTAITSAAAGPSDSQALLSSTPPQLSSTPPQLSPIRLSGRARGWMGSMRRALIGTERGDRSASASPEHDRPSHASSPTKSQHDADGVSRRPSAGPNPYRLQRGPGAWQTDGSRHGMNDHSPGHDEDWDVESAVENRVVQVTYTVPRERLRIVNPGPDGDGVSIPSRDGSLKGPSGGLTDLG